MEQGSHSTLSSSFVHTSPIRSRVFKKDNKKKQGRNATKRRKRPKGTKVRQLKRTVRKSESMPIFRRSLEDVEGVPYIMDPVGESDHQLQIGTSADGIPIKKYLPTKSFHVRPYSRSKRREQASSMLLGLDIDPSLKLVEQRQKHRHSLTVPLRNLREEEEDWAHFTSAAPSRSLAGPHTSVGYFEDMQVRNTTGSIMEKDSSLSDSEEQVPNSQSKNGGKTITEIYADAHLHAAEPAQLPFEPVVDRAKLMRLYKNKRLLQSCPLLPIVPAAPGKDEMPVVAKSSFFVVHGLKNSAKKQQTGGSVVGINASKEKSKRIIASSDVEKVPLTAAQQRRLSAPTYASRRIFGMNEYKKIVRGQMRIEEAQQEVREVAVESGNSALLRNTVTTAGNSDILHIDGEDLVLPPHRPFSAPSTAHNSDISMVSVSIVTRKGSSIVSQEDSTTFPLTEGKYLGIQDELEVPQHIFIKNRIIYVYIASTPHDFISERAELFGAVFPCLNKMLFSLGVCAIPVDMTFSEAVSSKRSGSMFSKFREIENCSFCVALRGAKYGDARSDESVKCEGNDGGSIEWLSSQHKTASSMELELMYALNCMESTGTGKMLAYFRDLSFLNIMQKEPDDSIREIFLPSGKEEEQAIKQTETLDSRLKKHPYCAPRAYSCSYKKSKNKRSPGRIEKLDQFVESVTNDLFESIRKSVSYFSTTPYEIEQSKQKNFFDIYSEGKAFCFDQKRALAETIENQLGTKPVMILGDPGSGKSSFSAWLHDHFQANDAYVPLTYFSQASVNSTNASNMMRYMLKEIDRVSGSISSPRSYFPNEPYSSLKQSFNHNLERLSMLAQKQGKRIVMIIDGVDNFVLGDGKSATMNDWLPTSLPNNLLMIFSAEKNSNATNWLFDWYKNNVYTVLTEEAMVNQNSRKKVIISVMNQCKVSWKTSIVNTLMKDKQLANPRSIRSYVYMVNQHSQENGQNPKLTKVMKTTPKIIESLHLHFFSSLELSLKSYLISTGYLSAVDLAFDNGGFPAEENLLGRSHSSLMLERIFGSLLCARNGLGLFDLSRLLFGANATSEETSIAIIIVRWVLQQADLVFPDLALSTMTTVWLPYGTFRDAVVKIYCPSVQKEAKHFQLLANYFAETKDEERDSTILQDLPYFQMKAFDVKALESTICNLLYVGQCCGNRSHINIGSHYVLETMKNYKNILQIMSTSVYKNLVKDFGKKYAVDHLERVLANVAQCLSFVQHYCIALQRDSRTWFQLALNLPPHAALHVQARRLISNSSASLPSNDWYNWINKPFRHSTSPVVYASFENGDITATYNSTYGCVLTIGHSDGRVYMLDKTTGNVVQTFAKAGHRNSVQNVFMLSYGAFLVSISARKIIIWDTSTGLVLCRTVFENDILASSEFPQSVNNTFLAFATGAEDGTVRLWYFVCDSYGNREVNDRSSKLTLPNASVSTCMAFTPCGTYLAIGCSDCCIRLYLVGESKLVFDHAINTEKQLGYVTVMEINPTSELIACSDSIGGLILLYSMDGSLLNTLTGHHCPVTSISWSLKPGFLVSASRGGRTLLWDLNKELGPEASVIDSAFTEATHVSFEKPSNSSSGGIIVVDKHFVKRFVLGTMAAATGSVEETVLSKFKIHYHAINGAKNARFQFRKDMLLKYMDNVSIGTHNGHVTCGAFSPSSHKLVTGSSSGEVSVVTYEKNQPPTERHILEGHSSSICKVLFSPKDAYLATAAIDGDIEIWDGTSYEHHKTLKWHTAPVTAMQFSKDLKSLVSGCGSGIVQRWDLATGAYVEFGSEMTKLNNMHKSSVLFVGFSEDEKRILSISKEGDIRIFTSESIDLLKICTTIQTHHLLEMARPCPHQPFKMYALLGSTFVSFSLIDVLDLEQFDGELSVENHISRTKTELYNRTRSNPENALQFPDKDVVALRDHLKVLQSEIEEKRNKSGMKAQTSINVQTVLKCKDKLAVKIFDVLASHGFKDENAVDKILCDRNGKGILVTSSLNDKMSKKSEFKTYGKVTCLGTCPHDPAMVFCGDSLGHVYILSHHTSGEMELDEPDIE